MKILTLIFALLMSVVSLPAQHLRSDADGSFGETPKDKAVVMNQKRFCPYCNEIHFITIIETLCPEKDNCSIRHFMYYCGGVDKYFVDLNFTDAIVRGDYREVVPLNIHCVSHYSLKNVIHFDSALARQRINSYPDTNEWYMEGTKVWETSYSDFNVRALVYDYDREEYVKHVREEVDSNGLTHYYLHP